MNVSILSTIPQKYSNEVTDLLNLGVEHGKQKFGLISLLFCGFFFGKMINYVGLRGIWITHTQIKGDNSHLCKIL